MKSAEEKKVVWNGDGIKHVQGFIQLVLLEFQSALTYEIKFVIKNGGEGFKTRFLINSKSTVFQHSPFVYYVQGVNEKYLLLKNGGFVYRYPR